MEKTADEQIVSWLKEAQHQEAALRLLLLLHGRRLLSECLAVFHGKSEAAAEDAMGDFLLWLLTNWQRWDPERERLVTFLSHWARYIALRARHREWRWLGRRRPLPDIDSWDDPAVVDSTAPSQQMEAQEQVQEHQDRLTALMDALTRAKATLNGQPRRVADRKFANPDASSAELAEALGMTPGAFYTNWNRAKTQIIDWLDRNGYGELFRAWFSGEW